MDTAGVDFIHWPGVACSAVGGLFWLVGWAKGKQSRQLESATPVDRLSGKTCSGTTTPSLCGLTARVCGKVAAADAASAAERFELVMMTEILICRCKEAGGHGATTRGGHRTGKHSYALNPVPRATSAFTETMRTDFSCHELLDQ